MYDHILCYITKLKNTHTHTHTHTHLHHLHFSSDITHDLICSHGIPQHQSSKQASTYPFLLILKPKKKMDESFM